jgi:ABC-2 type transport system permease protein
MNWRRIKIILKKDLLSIFGNKRVLIPMTITPLSLLVFTPLLLIYALTSGQLQNFNLPSGFLNNLPPSILSEIANYNETQKLIYLFCNYIMSALFLLMPLMISSWISAASMISEKENKTMETLLYAPVSKLELFLGKILGSYIPSLLVSYFGLVIYIFSVSLLTKDLFNGFIFTENWIYISLLLLPTTLLFGVTANIIGSFKAKNVQEAQQFSIIITFPFMMVLMGQIMGSFYVNSHFIIWLSVIFFVVDIISIYLISKLFSNENILKM